MEKLIELLNKQMEEKEKTGPKLARFTSYDGINKVFNLNNGCSFGVEFVLSKRYEFIKWLVNNNKINFLLIPNEIKEIGIPMKINGKIMYGFDSSDYYWLLMLLSIQDDPISFLISVLK